MSDTRNGGSAFPGVDYKAPVGGGSHMMTIVGGMYLRDYFAAKAMQALITGPEERSDHYDDEINEAVSVRAYLIADVMLKAREKRDD